MRLLTRPARCLALLVVPGAMVACSPAWALKGLKQVHVDTSAALEDPAAWCADFRLTAAQAGRALKASRVISAEAYLTEYAELPCKVSGTALRSRQLLRWELRAGGNGRLVHADGREEFLGCRSCAASFGLHKP